MCSHKSDLKFKRAQFLKTAERVVSPNRKTKVKIFYGKIPNILGREAYYVF